MPIISGSSVIRGSRGTPVAQDADDKLITVIQGSQGNAVAQDVNDRLIAMMYGAQGTPIAQDVNDYLITVIKGLYNGNLETVALDQDHAIKAVLYDPIDDWNMTQTIGLNELATRLGAIQGYDNRGRLLWADDFSSSKFRMDVTEAGGGIVVLNNDYAWSGESSARFILNGPNTFGTLWKRFYHPQTGVYGIEMTWSSSVVLWSSLKFGLIIYDGTYKWNYYIKLGGIARPFFMREQGFGNRTIGVMTCEIADRNFWHKWKIVADTTNGVIPRVMVDGVEYDASQYSVERIANATCPHIYAFVEFNNQDVFDMDGYVDNIVLTHMEEGA